jgi:hypothetical protein
LIKDVVQRMVSLRLMITACTLVLLGAAVNAQNDQPKQAMFKTEAEAQAAAPGFGCEGAHRMGEMWMVCAKHTDAKSHHGH